MSVTNTLAIQSKITKKNLVKEIADHLHMSQSDVEKVLDSFIDITSNHLQQRHDVRLTGFGIFSTRDRKASTARNPATGAEIHVQASVVPTFRPGSQLREKINPVTVG
jgi:DNA-binding protein HU-beta